MTAVAEGQTLGPAPLPSGSDRLPDGLFRYIAATSWIHQIPLVALTTAVFLLEVVPLELQRRVVNDAVKSRHYRDILLLCAAYAGAVLVQGTTKLGLNVYRAWVGERAKRDLRRRVSVAPPQAGADTAEARGTAVSMLVAEVEPVGNFIGASISEPLLQSGILATVTTYIFHIDVWMGIAALALFVPQMVFVPLMQHAMNRRTRSQVWLLRKIGAGMIARRRTGTLQLDSAARIDRIFRLNMGIFTLKYAMNFFMNLCTHAQVIAALLLGSWWVLAGELEIGGVVAFISGIGRITDPWGDLVNYFRDLSVNEVKFQLIADATNDPGTAMVAELVAD
jgi:ABC-type multidrug transport system fused ATPase/permease subunit